MVDSRQIVKDIYTLLRRLKPFIDEALAEYNHQLEQTWREYQYKMMARREGDMEQAFHICQRRMAEIKQAHKEKLEGVLL